MDDQLPEGAARDPRTGGMGVADREHVPWVGASGTRGASVPPGPYSSLLRRLQDAVQV